MYLVVRYAFLSLCAMTILSPLQAFSRIHYLFLRVSPILGLSASTNVMNVEFIPHSSMIQSFLVVLTSSTMTSADFWQFSYLLLDKLLQMCSVFARPPQVSAYSFFPCTYFIYCVTPLAVRTLFCLANSSNVT